VKVVAALECLRRWEEDCEGSGVAAMLVAVLWQGRHCGSGCFATEGVVALLRWQMPRCGDGKDAAIAVVALQNHRM
jgi:hypothetical protein